MSKKRKRSVDKTFSKAFSHYKPPEDITVSEWAEKYRVLSRESNAEAGRWKNERKQKNKKRNDSSIHY